MDFIKAQWSAAFISNLPDASFALIETGGKKDADGKTTPRNLRHLPYRDADGKADEAHVRNALSRLPQTTHADGSALTDSEKKAAFKKLAAAAKELGFEATPPKSTAAKVKELMHTKRFMAAEVKAIDDDASPNGRFKAVLSMPELDRDKEVIDAGAFNPLPPSIPIFSDHYASVATTVARAKPSYEGNALMVEGWFDADEHAQLVRNKVKNGFVPTMSVGYMSPVVEVDDEGVPHTKSAELLEGSFTPLPSLRQAMVQEAKSLSAILQKVGRRNSQTDQENIQTAHDALVAAGAQCNAEGDGSMNDGDESDGQESDGKALYEQVTKLLTIAEQGGEVGDLALHGALQAARIAADSH